MAGGVLGRLRGAVALPEDNQLARFVSMNLLGQGGSLVIGFVTSIALARLLGPGGRGLLGLMLSVNTLVIVVASIGLPTAVTYFSSLADSDPPALLGNCLTVGAILAAVLIPASWLLHRQIADAVGHGAGGLTWVLVAALASVSLLDWTTISQLQGALKFGRANVVVVVSRLVYAVGVAILLGVLSLGVAGGVIATGLGSLVMIVASLSAILGRSRPRYDAGLMKRMLSYGARAEVGSILQLANGRFDVIILQIYRPLSQVGYYVVAQTIAELVATLANEFRWTSMVLVTKSRDEAQQAITTADSVRHYTLLAAVAAVANVFLGSAVILVGYGSRYSPAIAPMLVLLPAVWILGIGIVIQGDLSGRGRPGLASTLAGFSAAITTGLDLLLIPSSGMIGAAVASLCGYSTLGVASIIVLHRISGIPIRAMIVPTRADLGGYWGFAVERLRRIRGGTST
ncbi:MAG: oligosaccharide flippase family protein [Solirubrobacteraceae bacterium]